MARRDMEMSVQTNGIAKNFDGIMLGEKVLRLVDNLSRTLQQKDIPAAEGQTAVHMTLDVLSTLQYDIEYYKFWEEVHKQTMRTQCE